MSAVDDEFAISFELSVSSKRLKKTCLLEHHMVNGVAYVPLQKRSKLALLVGQCKGGKYFEDTNVVEYVQEKRNDAVTQAMLKKISEDDIGAEEACTTIPKDQRTSLFNRHNIAAVLDVSVPGFKSELHKHGPIVLKVLATPSLRALPSINLDHTTLKWLAAASTFTRTITPQHAYKRAPSILKRAFGPLEPLPDKIKVRSCTANRLCLYIMYKTGQGKWAKHYKTVMKSGYESEQALQAGIQETIDDMAKFYEENHDFSGNADDDDASADDQDGTDDDEYEDGEQE